MLDPTPRTASGPLVPLATEGGAGRLPVAVAAGLAAALVGAAIWAAVAYFTHMQLGLVAVAVGALVGFAVRGAAGWSGATALRIIGGACAAVGWAVGTLLADVALLAQNVNQPFLAVLSRLDAGRMLQLAQSVAAPMDALFFAICVYEGQKFAVRTR